jgi:hypothetical protein
VIDEDPEETKVATSEQAHSCGFEVKNTIKHSDEAAS